MATVEIDAARKALRRLSRAEGREPHRQGRRVRRASSAPPAAASPRCCASIAGLEDVDGGDDPHRRRATSTDLEPRERDIAMVFQSYALYPHMTVRDNMAFSPRACGARRRPRSTPRVDEAARILGIEALLEPQAARALRRPAAARGDGPRDRAPARRLFLFDEPLSNLDAQLRVQMRAEIRALHDRLGATSVYVTHDQVEAMTMADRIVVLDAGRIVAGRRAARALRAAGQPLRRRASSARRRSTSSTATVEADGTLRLADGGCWPPRRRRGRGR